jgi:hypothetical protein
LIIIELVPRFNQEITARLQNMEYWDVDWVISTQARVQKQAVINTRINIYV